jgi:hypothetical protein
MTQEQARAFEKRIRTAPELDLPRITSTAETGKILHVRRMGILRPDYTARGPLDTPGGTPWLETVDGQAYRLPASLASAVYDLVALSLGMGAARSGMFPSRMEFGIINGRAYAQFADQPG